MPEFNHISTNRDFPFIFLGKTYKGKETVKLTAREHKQWHVPADCREISARQFWARQIVIPLIEEMDLPRLSPDERAQQIIKTFGSLPITTQRFFAEVPDCDPKKIEETLVKRVMWLIREERWIDLSNGPKFTDSFAVYQKAQQIHWKETKKAAVISSALGLLTLATTIFSVVKYSSLEDNGLLYSLIALMITLSSLISYMTAKYLKSYPISLELDELERSIFPPLHQ